MPREYRHIKDNEKEIIAQYIHFYDHQRIQLKTKLTPLEMRSQFVA